MPIALSVRLASNIDFPRVMAGRADRYGFVRPSHVTAPVSPGPDQLQ